MISGIDLTQAVDYTLKNDKDNPTIWKLGVIPASLLGKFSINSKTEEQFDTAFKLLQVSLRGWENYSIPFRTEKQVIFGRELDVVPLSLIDSMPLKVINELITK